jgi:molecular chaperone GrpE
MSNDQEMPDTQVEEAVVERETTAEAQKAEVVEETHTEVGEHEYTLEELKKELEETKQKAHENWDKAVRAQAEMENLKRRTQKDLEDAHKFALTGFAKELLSVMDSLMLGLQAATGDSEEVIKFREGSELTIKQLEAAFAKFNIVTVDPIGQPFSAELHQAVLMQAVDGAEPNTVVNVFQKGYMLNGRLLRPAMVVVAKVVD